MAGDQVNMISATKFKLRSIDEEVMYCGPFFDVKYTRCPHSEAGNGHAEHIIDIGRLQQLFGADWFNRLLFQTSWKFGPTTKTHDVTVHLPGNCATALDASDFESGGNCHPQDATPGIVHVHISKRPLPSPDPTWPAPVLGYVPRKLSSRLLTRRSMYRPVPGLRRPEKWNDGIRRTKKLDTTGILDDATMANNTASLENMSEDDSDEDKQYETQVEPRFETDSPPDLPTSDSVPQSATTTPTPTASRASTQPLREARDTMMRPDAMLRDHSLADISEASHAALNDDESEPMLDNGDDVSQSGQKVSQQLGDITPRQQAGRSSTVPPSLLPLLQPTSESMAENSQCLTPPVRNVHDTYSISPGRAHGTTPLHATALQDRLTVPQSPVAKYDDIHEYPLASHGTPNATIPSYGSGKSPAPRGTSELRTTSVPPSTNAAKPAVLTSLNRASASASRLEDRLLALRGQGTHASPLDPPLSSPATQRQTLLPQSHPSNPRTYKPRPKTKKTVASSFPKELDDQGIGASVGRDLKTRSLLDQSVNTDETCHEPNNNASGSENGPEILKQAGRVMPRTVIPYPYETDLTPHRQSHQARRPTSTSPMSSVAPMSMREDAGQSQTRVSDHHQGLGPLHATKPDSFVEGTSASPKRGIAEPELHFINEFSTQRQKSTAAQSNARSSHSPMRQTGSKTKASRINKSMTKDPRAKVLTPVERQKLIDSARASNSLSPMSTSRTQHQHLPKADQKARRASDTMADSIAKKAREEPVETSAMRPPSAQPSFAPNALSGLPTQKEGNEAEVYNDGRLDDGRDFTFDTLSLPIAENEQVKDDEVKMEDM